jgi:DNA-binding winged helix-turn-helix (wHTH) protein/tetratricopeptide (TPR) repeat protein
MRRRSPFNSLTNRLPFPYNAITSACQDGMESPYYRFGPFLLDTDEHRLSRHGRPVALSKRPMAVLIVLVRNAGHLVTKDQLLAEAWNNTVVVDNALSVAISRLRHALGTSGNDDIYIETVSGYGYRFVAEVSVHETPDRELSYQRSFRPAVLFKRLPVLRRRALGSISVVALLIIFVALSNLSGERMPATLSLDSRIGGDTDVEATVRRESATDAYHRGRQELDRRRWAGGAITSFSLARAIDSTYALAYLGLADAYAMGHGSHIEAMAMVQRALELDPNLSEAYATIGFIHGFQRWNWPAAEEAFGEALRKAPDHARSHQWYAAALLVQRYFDEAETAIRRALAIDPQSANLHADLCEILAARRAFAEAKAACHTALSYDPGFPFARSHLFWIHLMENDLDEARKWSFIPEDAVSGSADYDGSNAAYFRALARRAEELSNEHPHEAYFLARIQAIRGEGDAALDALERAVRMKAFHAPFVNADPAFDWLRDTPAFQKSIAEMRLQ